MKVFLAFVAMAICSFHGKGQSLSNYTAVRNTSVAYSSIAASGTSFGSWRNTSNLAQDDNRSDFTDIGFDFWYNGVRYTRFSASTNGFIDFSASTDDGGPAADDFGYDNTAFTDANLANSTRPAIAAFYDDLTAPGGGTPLAGALKYLVTGAAPSRTLTVEWINMAVYQNVTPNLNFQVQLLEGSGIIKINYGVMNTGNHQFSYTMGCNGPQLSLIPTAAQLRLLQTVNSNVFSNVIQNNLVAMPASYSQYIFTPPVPAPAAGNLNFSAVSQTGIQLNWSNWAINETGYVVYVSTDNVNFEYAGQTSANITSYNAGGLLPGTVHYWRVMAVTEGFLSSALSNSQTTNAAGIKLSTGNGNWNNAATWSPSGVPGPGDNVGISSGHVVSINTNAVCNSLTVGVAGAATLRFTNNTVRTCTVNGDITIGSGSVFQVLTSSNATHQLTVRGNIINNGTLNFASDNNSLCNLSCVGNTSQTVTGSGISTRFSRITLSKTSGAELLVSSNSFSASNNFLTLNSGILNLSTPASATITAFTGATNIAGGSGIILNSPNMILISGANISLSGTLSVQNGTLQCGNAVNEGIQLLGGVVDLTAGALNVAGMLYVSSLNEAGFFSQSGGTLTVPASGASQGNIAPFQIIGSGSVFNLSGGKIVIPAKGGSAGQDLGFENGAGGGLITGGTLQIGTATTPANQTISINSNWPIPNLSVNSTNAAAKLSNSLVVNGDVVIGSGTLNANNFNIDIGGSWFDTGSFSAGNATVFFSGNMSQDLYGAGGENFNSLVFSGSGTKTFFSPVNATGSFLINSGSTVTAGPGDQPLLVNGNIINNGAFLSGNGLVTLSGSSVQTIAGTNNLQLNNLNINNASGVTLGTALSFRGTLLISNGVFSTNGNALTLLSSVSQTGRIGPIGAGGDLVGNVIVQRYVPGGATGWALWGSPVTSGASFQDWDDDIYITCPGCPDGYGGFNSIYSYNEAAPGVMDAGASYLPQTVSQGLVQSRGYWVYVGTGQYTTNPVNLDITGPINKFGSTIPLSHSNYGNPANDGWNLIANPYPSPISWTLLRGATPNVDNAVYVYNTDLNSGAGGYATYVNGISSPGTGAGGIGDAIPMGQGFYVHATGAASLTVTESVKVSSNQSILKSSQQAGAQLRLHLSGGPSAARDEAVLYEEAMATDNFEPRFDAFKLAGQNAAAPLIALQKDSILMQVSGVAPIAGTYTTALKVTSGYSGVFTITASGVSSFKPGTCITLYDRFLNVSCNLTQQTYSFVLSDTTSVYRFILNISLNYSGGSSIVQQPACSNPSGGSIVFVPGVQGVWSCTWKDGQGNIISNKVNQTGNDTLAQLKGGKITFEAFSLQCARHEESFFIIPVELPSLVFKKQDTLYVGTPAEFTSLSENLKNVAWNLGDGTTASGAVVNHTYLQSGVYSVALTGTTQSNCSDTLITTISVQDRGNTSLVKLSGEDLLVRWAGVGDYEIIAPSGLIQEYRILNGDGRTLQSVHLDHPVAKISVNLGNYAKGICYLFIAGVDGVIKLISD